MVKTPVNYHTQKGTPILAHMGWELAGEDVIEKEVGGSPGKREVRCSAAREMYWETMKREKWLEVLLTRQMRVFQHSVFL